MFHNSSSKQNQRLTHSHNHLEPDRVAKIVAVGGAHPERDLIDHTTRFNAFNGKQVVAALRAHPDLWEAVLMDRDSLSNPDRLPSMGLIKLRDLSSNLWNVDTLYVLTPDVPSASQLAEIAQEWGGMVYVHDDSSDVEDALGAADETQAIVSIWWD